MKLFKRISILSTILCSTFLYIFNSKHTIPLEASKRLDSQAAVLEVDWSENISNVEEESSQPINGNSSLSEDLHEPNKVLKTIMEQPKLQNSLNSIKNYSQMNYEPRLVLGEIRTQPKLLLGIPSIARKNKDYLKETLDSFVKRLSAVHRNEVIFLVYLADTSDTVCKQRLEDIYPTFKNLTNEGVITFITPPEELLPNWKSKLYLNFGDNLSRTKWRSKQNLDMKFLLNFAIRRFDPIYFLMVEDDILPEMDYDDTIITFAGSKPTTEWTYCDFSWIGGGGKLFHKDSMRDFALFLEIFWNAKPLDWLLWDLIRGKMCGYSDKTDDECKKKSNKLIHRYDKNVFTHVGKVSSRSSFGIEN